MRAKREVVVRFVGGGPHKEDELGFTTLDFPPIEVEGGCYVYESFEDVDGESGEAIYRWEPTSYECPACHTPLIGPSEVCNGALGERDHPTGVKAVVAKPGGNDQ